MNNKKLELHKQIIDEMQMLLKQQEKVEEMWDFDPEYVKQRENITIMEYSAKLAGLNQLAFQQISNAKVIGDIRVNDSGNAEVLKNHLLTPVS